ncbi:TetR family transcriptional regulator [Prauserella shujinwangii]|uniref:TetR family transcriptional regulator n=2 Tax=Prauserella shujinwangii TaxID=1453103 RepID=A0A2T0LWF1_9PSEU|nr:TetR family transcriptional regulator [Prauserella shujinwangii]
MDQRTGTGLPASFELAWGVREQPNKGPKRGLSLDRIIATAIAVADAEGLRAVSMGRVATELGAAPMSLYRYVATKDELLTLAADAAYGPPPDVPLPGEDWRSALARWARAERDGLRARRWILQIPISGPPTTPNAVAWMDRALRCVEGTGLDAGERMGVLLLVTGFVRSNVLIESQIVEAMEAAGQPAETRLDGYGKRLAAVADRARFPALHAVIDTGVLDEESGDENEDFDFGLDRVLDGIEALIGTRSLRP